MCDYLNIYCFKVEPVSQSTQTVSGVTTGRSVPCNGSIVRTAVDTLLRRDRATMQASATDSSRSSSASSSCDVIDSHHVTTRAQMAHARALRQTHPQQHSQWRQECWEIEISIATWGHIYKETKQNKLTKYLGKHMLGDLIKNIIHTFVHYLDFDIHIISVNIHFNINFICFKFRQQNQLQIALTTVSNGVGKMAACCQLRVMEYVIGWLILETGILGKRKRLDSFRKST